MGNQKLQIEGQAIQRHIYIPRGKILKKLEKIMRRRIKIRITLNLTNINIYKVIAGSNKTHYSQFIVSLICWKCHIISIHL
jgi:hypothetical protein